MDFNSHNDLKVNDTFLEQSEGYKIITNNHQQLRVAIKKSPKERIITLPRTFYKGYRIMLNSKQHFSKPALTKNGLVATKIPQNFSGTVTVLYHTTALAKLGWALTFLTLLTLIWILLTDSLREKIKRSIGKLISKFSLNSSELVEK